MTLHMLTPRTALAGTLAALALTTAACDRRPTEPARPTVTTPDSPSTAPGTSPSGTLPDSSASAANR